MKLQPAILLLLLALACGGCSAARDGWTWCVGSIPAKGGRELQLCKSGKDRLLLQKDPRWADEPLGPTKLTLGTHGCVVTSASMACTCLDVPLTPKELNKRLHKQDGYLSNGWMVWSAIPRVTEDRLTAAYHSIPAHRWIDDALERGECPIVKYRLPQGTPHWCLVVGKDGLDYLVRDPLRDEKEPLKLAALTKRIRAVRVIRTNVMREE
jgi:hypothetical protein